MCIRDRGNTINGVASGAATLPQLYDIEDAIYHKVDSCIFGLVRVRPQQIYVTVNSSSVQCGICLLYTSDAADERSSVDLGGRRIIKKKKNKKNNY